jgi:hypothetical protein
MIWDKYLSGVDTSMVRVLTVCPKIILVKSIIIPKSFSQEMGSWRWVSADSPKRQKMALMVAAAVRRILVRSWTSQ